MGKVGSSSLRESIKKHGIWPVSHTHRMSPEYIEEIKAERAQREIEPVFPSHHAKGLELYREIVRPGRRAKFVSLVRNPVDRNISAFFFNCVTEKENWENLSVQELRDSFISKYPHEVPLAWFDREPKATLGIDVYSRSFPHGRGYSEFQNGPFELLVLRTELSDDRKAEVVEQFLGISDFEIWRCNAGQSKDYAGLYNLFKQEVSLPDSYLDRMLQSRYAQHFYSAEEIDQTYSAWT